uniref:hypothetical protein n=1 Tax=Castellaniella defragrans TaxID=75697 RepID=UPI00334165DB
MEIFNVAISVLMIVIMLGQLAISIVMHDTKSTIAIRRFIAARWYLWFATFFSLIGFSGIANFAFRAHPERMDYYFLATGCFVLSGAYTMFVASHLYRRTDQLLLRVQQIERLLIHPSEPSEEASGG